MTSVNKKNKLKNAYCIASMLKDTSIKLKRGLFFHASHRKANNKIDLNE